MEYKKILFVSTGYKPVPDVKGGAIEHLMTQILEQNEITPHYDFTLITIRDKNIRQEKFLHTKIIQIKDFRKTFFLRAFSFLLNIFYKLVNRNLRFSYLGRKALENAESDTDFILVENDVNIFKQIANKHLGIPLVFHLHNDFNTFGEIQKNTDSMRFVVDNACEIWTVSAYLKRHLLSAFPNVDESKILVLENCIDKKRFSANSVTKEQKNEFCKKYGITETDFVILYSGRILKQKGVLELIKAVSILPEDISFKLVICGDLKTASKKYCKQLFLEAEKIKQKVVFTGYIPQYEIQTAYAVSRIVAIPSQWEEAFCLTALEASSHCRPCVASISGGMTDVLDSSCAKMILLGENFVQDFSNAILELFNNKELLEKMGESAGKRAALFPNEDEYFKNFCSLADNFMSKNINNKGI